MCIPDLLGNPTGRSEEPVDVYANVTLRKNISQIYRKRPLHCKNVKRPRCFTKVAQEQFSAPCSAFAWRDDVPS